MTEPVTLAELKTPGRRVRAVESVLQGLQLLGGAGEVELISNWPLSEPSRTWLERMCSAVCDPELSARSWQELRGAFDGYLASLEGEERFMLKRELSRFEFVKSAIEQATK